ncbi:hypothetical protein BBJ28_00025575 [Nothophytophthora sp. Chile5]|nr:hypothetical protein BBJ28_00025575 [Nothophytophthora sp. Chile5]
MQLNQQMLLSLAIPKIPRRVARPTPPRDAAAINAEPPRRSERQCVKRHYRKAAAAEAEQRRQQQERADATAQLERRRLKRERDAAVVVEQEQRRLTRQKLKRAQELAREEKTLSQLTWQLQQSLEHVKNERQSQWSVERAERERQLQWSLEGAEIERQRQLKRPKGEPPSPLDLPFVNPAETASPFSGIVPAMSIDTTTKRGGRKKYTALEIRSVIRQFVIDENEATRPITAAIIASHVAKVLQKEKLIPVRSMRRLLRRMGLFHIRGKNRNYLAEREHNVVFRAAYLQKKLDNRDSNKNPVRPEVFLDESYVNVNHVAGKTWLTEDKVRKSKSGRGPRICIVAAGIITCPANLCDGSSTRARNDIQGAFVEGSIVHWNSASKKRKSADDDDYHGNFNAELFESWFEKLCATLEVKHGPCNIHMDGASYHKRLTNPSPNKSWLKPAIQNWLEDHGILYEPRDVIAQLLERVNLHRPVPIYEAQKTATKHGHLLYFTPPYHPELQPIELVWGLIKNRIALNRASNATDLNKKVAEELGKVTPENWCKYYRHVQKFENKYLKALDDCPLISDVEGSEEEGEDADSSDEEDDEVIHYSF